MSIADQYIYIYIYIYIILVVFTRRKKKSFQLLSQETNIFSGRMVLQLVLPIILILEVATAAPVPDPNCPTSCGDIGIPYPFGIGSSCSRDEWFTVTCNDSMNYNPRRFVPFLSSINLEILEITPENGTLLVRAPRISSNCPDGTDPGWYVNLTDSPFSFSDTRNVFAAIGCNTVALITEGNVAVSGCMSICNDNKNKTTPECTGISCCQVTVPHPLKYVNASLGSIDPTRDVVGECKYAFLVEPEWWSSFIFLSDTAQTQMQYMNYVPTVLEWGIYNANCASDCDDVAVCSNRSTNGANGGPRLTQCSCSDGFLGNPYVAQGCQDIDECSSPNLSDCRDRICVNTRGNYYCRPAEKSRVKEILLGIAAGIGTLFFLIGTWGLYKLVKRRREFMLKEKFFKQNGGLLLQQQLSSGEGNVEHIKVFSSKELEIATDHYNENRILGQGGQGTVYKGMLTDGRIVAVKKSKIMDEGKLGQFINEVVILSQINHRNVVKILGCCLETEVPLLIYEFIPNGTLSEHICEQNEEFPFTWEMRLQVATEVAGALSYLHSAASIPIFHRDIKSTNILLDEKYRAKVADFGTSKTIAVDKTHLTTLVQGTFGYLDPEYFQTSQFTDKSDVYSFGVVLVELLTGQKPISQARSEERRNLAIYFIFSMENNSLSNILDDRVVKEGGKDEIEAVANLAKRCLNLNGKNRPTMKEVAMELERIKKSRGGSKTQQNYEEVEYALPEVMGPWSDASISDGPYTNSSIDTSFDDQSLLIDRSRS